MEDVGQTVTEACDGRLQNSRYHLDRVTPLAVDNDYWNEYFILHMIWSSHSPEAKKQFLKENPVKRYTQKYPEEHEDLVAFSNHHKARVLDEIATDVNALAHSESFSEEVLERLIREVYRIIYRRELKL